MVRKTTAQVKATKENNTTATDLPQDRNIDRKAFANKCYDDLKAENWKTYLGFILIICAAIQLRHIIGGIILLTIGLALVFGLFSNDKK